MNSAVAMAASRAESGPEAEIDEAKEPGPEGVGWSGPAEAANRETLAGGCGAVGCCMRFVSVAACICRWLQVGGDCPQHGVHVHAASNSRCPAWHASVSIKRHLE